jgi:hypothetical protein
MEYALLVYGDTASAYTATTVHGDTVTDGPAVAANQTLESVRVLEAESLDDAIEYAQRLRRDVTVEIRPVSAR